MAPSSVSAGSARSPIRPRSALGSRGVRWAMARAHVWVRQASLGLLAAALVTYPVAEPPHAALPAGQQYSAAPVLRAVTPGVVNIATRSLETFANPLLRDPAVRELISTFEK